jgi:DNA polymerase III subunit alpha
MIETIIKDLLEWCSKNHIKVDQIKDRLFEFPGHGRGFLLIPDEEGHVVDSEMMFPMEDEFFFGVQKAIEEKLFDFFVFQFGKMFFYAKPEIRKNSFNEERYNVDFLDLKYLGENTLEIDIPLNPLGIHTQYEILNGSGLKNHIKKAKFFGCTYIGMCDKNTLAGTLSWQTECEKLGMKSILGETIDVAINYNPTKNEIPETYELKLYVTSFTGWQNLLQINKWINVDCAKFIPEEELVKYTNGLICVCGFNTDLNWNDKKSVVKWLVKMKGFHKILFQVDIGEWYDEAKDLKSLRYLNQYLKDYVKLIPPVLINDIYYVDPEEYVIKDYLNKIGRKASDYSEDQYLKSFDDVSSELGKFFKDEEKFYEILELGLKNLNWVCQECGKFKIETGERRFPEYESKDGKDNEELFLEIVKQGFKKKIIERGLDEQIYLERLEMELKVIKEGALISYFLILWDVIEFARYNNIMVGPGRGSVCGSLVAFVMGLVETDPVLHNLMFERFLNVVRILPEIFYKCKYKNGEEKLIREKEKELLNEDIVSKIEIKKFRKDSADVDTDFQTEYRDLIKEYISQRFGDLQVCSVGTFVRFQPRGCLKDLGNIAGLKFSYVNAVTKYIPNKATDYSWRDFVEYAVQNKELKKFFQDHPEIVIVAKSLIDQPKTQSVHASAVLVLPSIRDGQKTNIFNWLPIRLMDGKYVSEFEGEHTDLSGYLKEDILGLNQLDKFQKCLSLIKENHCKDIDLETISLKDKKVYSLFQQGYNEDVFQFNSNGLKSYCKKAKPDCFEDLISINALWRPGPMDSNAHIDFALMKTGKKKPHFDYGLKEVTKNTQGLYVYQEQIMAATMVLGGFTASESDIFRTRIKKFQKDEMKKDYEKFINGAIKNGCPPKEADKIWLKLLAFGQYGFNRAHACAYALVAYRSQWFKANYPLEFWSAAISFADETEIPNMLSEIDHLKQGIKIKPPSINNSTLDFTCDSETNNIYWSLTKIKGLGVKTVQPIIDERDKNGQFKSYQDFINRVPKAKVNKAHIEKLILAGAFDSVCNVHQVTERIDVIKEHCKMKAHPVPEQYTKFENIGKTYFWISRQRLLTGLGTVDYKQLILKLPHGEKIAKLYKTPERFYECKDYEVVSVAGSVSELIQKKTRKGDSFVILKILSNNEMITMLVWSDYLEDNADFLEDCLNKTICVIGKVRYDNYHNQNSLQSVEETKFYYL